ncbi:MAG: hypothetical protein J6S76_00640 [Clostridia bacterium]|nr:hypothetical protein [Clostridia bacterium]
MKFEWNKRYTTYAIYAAAVLISAILLIFLFIRWEALSTVIGKILNVCKPLIYAVGIAYLLWPLMRFFETKIFSGLEKKRPRKKLVRVLSLICVYLILIAVLVLFFGTIIPQISSSISLLLDRMTTYLSTAQSWIDNIEFTRQ